MHESAIKFNHNLYDSIAKFFKSVNDFFVDVAVARAAAELTRQGYHKEARDLILMHQNNEFSD